MNGDNDKEKIEDLVIRAQHGDLDAFTELSYLIKGDLYRTALAKMKNVDDAKDMIQEAMIIAFKRIKRIREPKYFKSWVVRVVINLCNKAYKKKEKQRKIFEKLSKRDPDIAGYRCFDRIERKFLLEEYFNLLNDKEKECVYLFYYNEYTLEEISKILKISTNTINSRIYRAKEKVREYCEERGIL